MLLTLTTTHAPATDLGFLLMKHPERLQTFDLTFGRAYVFYPEASAERCTAALLVEVDPIELVRGRPGAQASGEGGLLAQYVNDRPYAACSFLSVALAAVYRTAMSGESRERPELAAVALPLEARLSAVPCRGGEGVLRRLFEPLGYTVTAERHPLQAGLPDAGESHYYAVTLSGTRRLCELLSHLYVLVPVLDGEKHYWLGDAEVEKLLRHGEGWLAEHPEREFIAQRYLKRRSNLVREALRRLTIEEEPQAEEAGPARDAEEAEAERPLRLNEARMEAVLSRLRAAAANWGSLRVLDLGCGAGRLTSLLMKERVITAVTGLDLSYQALEAARRRLRLDQQRTPQERVRLLHGALTYRDERLAGYDAAAVVEVIEHLDPHRLASFERVLFEHARPRLILITTPNREYNVRWETLPAGRFRHRDHRFEWTRAEFRTWAERAAERFGYGITFEPIGPDDPELGAPTQMGVFVR
jgi:3' terminal RNA ribose 2'-O-methyltransferase Hen1